MRTIEWEHPNKMRISTGHEAFDEQCSALIVGNAITDTQESHHIRAFTDTKLPWGDTHRPPGALQDFDLSWFDDLPADVAAYVREQAHEKSVILYELRHFDDSDRIVVDGYVVTDTAAGGHTSLRAFYTGPTDKSAGIVDTAREYISNPA